MQFSKVFPSDQLTATALAVGGNCEMCSEGRRNVWAGTGDGKSLRGATVTAADRRGNRRISADLPCTLYPVL
jgi:hypothetical protein